MGVTFDHYRVRIDLHNEAKQPFDRSEWIDVYLNPFRYMDEYAEIAYKLGVYEEDILNLHYVEEDET